MLQPSRITIGKLGRLLVYTALLGLLVSAGSAFGQLTEQDIEELQQRGEREGWTFEVSMNPACEYTIDELCGLEEPPNWREGAKFNDMSAVKRTIPEQFDWRDSDGVTPVRNQGSCGS
jgi:C1A family cysteine protease